MPESEIAISAVLALPLHEVAPNLTIWPRAARPGFRALFHHLVRSGFEAGGTEGRLAAIRFDRLLPAVPPGLAAWRHALLQDIRELAGVYSRRSGCDFLRVKLETETTNRCRFFHTDNIGLRLLCSYDGPGTEWVPDSAVNRSALGRGSNRDIIRDESAIQRMPSWWVGLFAGNNCPGLDGRGCVHRSPEIESLGRTRILLCIDGVSDTN